MKRSPRLEFRSRVLMDVRLSAYARLIYMILDDQFADQNGRAWPKQPKLAAYAGLSRRLVQNALYELQKADYLTIQKTRFGCNYSLSWIAPVVRNGCTGGAQSKHSILYMNQKNTEPVAPPTWKTDPDFVAFCERYRELAEHFIEEDYEAAFTFVWKSLALPERLERMAGLKVHTAEYAADPRFIPKPRKFLETEWKRPLRPARRGENVEFKYSPPPYESTIEYLKEQERKDQEKRMQERKHA